MQSPLANLNVNKGYGHDGMSNKVLKQAGDALAPSLTKIFNICIDEKEERGMGPGLQKG